MIIVLLQWEENWYVINVQFILTLQLIETY